MILDDYTCDHCGVTEEGYRGDDNRCPKCGRKMRREFPRPSIDMFHEYYDESLDQTFTSRWQKKAYLKEKGLMHLDKYNSQPSNGKKGVIYSFGGNGSSKDK